MVTGKLGTRSNSQSYDSDINANAQEDESVRTRKLLKRMRIQIWAGTAAGFLIALAIGAAFIAVVSAPSAASVITLQHLLHPTEVIDPRRANPMHQFYTKVTDLWANTEEIWEGVFSLVACILIYIMGIAFLKMDRSRVKWRIKLADAFEKSHSRAISAADGKADKRDGRSGKWALFLLPFITVLREGLEAVVFVGGVSLPP